MRIAYVIATIGLVTLLAVPSATDARRDPLERSRAGQWTIHRTMMSPGSLSDATYVYEWVVKVDGRKVLIKTQPLDPDLQCGLASSVESVIDLDAPAPRPLVESPLGEEEVSARGTRLLCRKVETVEAGDIKGKTISWLSDLVPISGLAKRVKLDPEGKELFRTELIDWGETGGAEKPLAPPMKEGKAPLHKN
jgi:hypothetical protein